MPSKEAYFSKIEESSITTQTASNIKFLFSNVAYRSTVYKTGLLGESCQENRIYLNQKMPLVATSSTTSTNVVSSSPSGNTVKLCDRPAEKSVRPKQSEFAQFLGPTFGLDTIYGDIEKRLTGLSDTLPFVCLNKYKISPAFIENSGFQSFRHEI